MNVVREFFFLVRQTLSVPSYVKPVTIGMLSIIFATWLYTHIIRKRPFDKLELMAFVPFVTSLLLLMWGTLFAHQDSQTNGPSWPIYINYTIFAFHIPISGLVIWKVKGFRLLAVETSLFAGWCAFWTWFTTAMAVSGDWL